jgi:amino acid permease
MEVRESSIQGDHGAVVAVANDDGHAARTVNGITSTPASSSSVLPAGENSASILNEIFNLVKNIVGSGGFSLPAAIATFGNNPSALMPSAILIIVMGLVNAYTFSLLGRICCFTESRSYKDAWNATVGLLERRHHQDVKKRNKKSSIDNSLAEDEERLLTKEQTEGGTHHYQSTTTAPSSNNQHHHRSKSLFESLGKISWGTHTVAIVVVAKTFLGCWAFSIMLCSSFQPLLFSLGYTNITSAQAIILLTTIVLLPLCMSRTFSALAGFSAFGQLGTIFAVTVMIIRYLDGSYAAPNGKYYATLQPQYLPQFGNQGWSAVFQPQALILVSILSTGYVAHYNAPKFYYELKDHTPERFNIVVGVSFICSAIIYGMVSSVGFLTFGGHCAGYILDNYSTADPLAFVARFGIVLSLAFSYPLLFIGGREGLLDLIKVPLPRRTPLFTKISTVMLLAVITLLAIAIPNLTFVLAFGGATLSTCLIYIFPALMLRAMVLNTTVNNNSGGKDASGLQTHDSTAGELKLTKIIMCCGTVAGVCGATIAVLDTIG